MQKKTHLFYLFLAIYAVTAAVTLLGITNVFTIKDGYLTPLMGAFLIELGGAVILIFKNADFFSEPDFQLNEANQSTVPPDVAAIDRLTTENARLTQELRIAAAQHRIEIRSAHYGAFNAQADVTETVKQHVINGTLNLFVTTRVLGGVDPAPQIKKVLTLTYRLGGNERNLSILEGSTVVLP